MKGEDLRALLTNREVFPVEITLSSGDKIKVTHPDFVHYAGRLDKIFIFPEEGGLFDWIMPKQIAKIRANVKRNDSRAA